MRQGALFLRSNAQRGCWDQLSPMVRVAHTRSMRLECASTKCALRAPCSAPLWALSATAFLCEAQGRKASGHPRCSSAPCSLRPSSYAHCLPMDLHQHTHSKFAALFVAVLLVNVISALSSLAAGVAGFLLKWVSGGAASRLLLGPRASERL